MRKILFLLILCLLALMSAACAAEPAAPPVNVAAGTENNDSPVPAAESAPDIVAASQEEEESVLQEDENVVVIREKMFIAQCNDIYLNPEDYMDKTIKLEGMYQEYADPNGGTVYHYINRNGPGCCVDDGVIGFEILFDGEKPKVNDWIEAVGKVEIIEEGNAKYLALRLSQLTVLEKRGAEYVAN